MSQNETFVSKDILLYIYNFLNKTTDKQTVFNLAALNKKTYNIIYKQIRQDYKYVVTVDNYKTYDGTWNHIYVKPAENYMSDNKNNNDNDNDNDNDNENENENNDENEYYPDNDIQSAFFDSVISGSLFPILNIIEYGKTFYFDKSTKYCRISPFGTTGENIMELLSDIKYFFGNVDILHMCNSEWHMPTVMEDLQNVVNNLSLTELILDDSIFKLSHKCIEITKLTTPLHLNNNLPIHFFPNLQYLNMINLYYWEEPLDLYDLITLYLIICRN